MEKTSSKMEEVEVKIIDVAAAAAEEGEDDVIDDDDDIGIEDDSEDDKDTIGDRGDGGAGDDIEKGAVNEDGVGVVGFGVVDVDVRAGQAPRAG